MEGSREFLDRYTKIKHVIDSCETRDHVKVARQMITNLNTLCIYNALPYDFYIFYINQLKSFLNKKENELS
jgi:hypothetical protein